MGPPPDFSASPHAIVDRINKAGSPGFMRLLLKIPAWTLIGMVRLYQWTFSPVLGRRCRFEPNCSAYFIESVRKYGAIRGACRGLWRICRCNPWNPGGFDPP